MELLSIDDMEEVWFIYIFCYKGVVIVVVVVVIVEECTCKKGKQLTEKTHKFNMYSINIYKVL